MHGMQLAGRHAVGDGAGTQAELEQLPPRESPCWRLASAQALPAIVRCTLFAPMGGKSVQ
jgi:hypothetical protein